ncbi:MAG: T9SS type A sorting domain-containing protein [Flavobacteriales bacterium]|nr:T9SS type A sorting domain-containing protein [Flavobacteriales bacterium]
MEQTQNHSDNTSISTSVWSAGIYFFRIADASTYTTKKVLIQ